MPKVSVVMSVHNGETYLRDAIDSILNQSFKDFEFIIINDGSADKTEEILAGYQDSRLRIVRQANHGLTRSLNKGIQLSKGKYIARMDADDVSLPERLEKQVDFLDKTPSIGVLGTACFEIDGNDKKVAYLNGLSDQKTIRKTLIKKNVFCHSSLMFRREVFGKVGCYDDEFKYSQDYELLFRIAEHFDLANLPEALLLRRNHPKNISLKRENEQITCAISARKKAINRGQYSITCYFYLLRPYFVKKTPFVVRKLIRKHVLRKRLVDRQTSTQPYKLSYQLSSYLKRTNSSI